MSDWIPPTTDNFKFFCHKACEFYPCHDIEELNCLWCYCPLQTKKDCPGILDGSAKYLDNNYKDCTKCLFPHDKNNYDEMLKQIDKMIGN